MCETPELIEKLYIYTTQTIARYSCPKCHWRVEGLAATQPLVKVPLASTETRRGMRAHERLDQPMTRYHGPVDRVNVEVPRRGA